MKYSYYPGCTLKNKAKDLDAYARASARALGFELEEIEDWQCCGGVYPLGQRRNCHKAFFRPCISTRPGKKARTSSRSVPPVIM